MSDEQVARAEALRLVLSAVSGLDSWPEEIVMYAQWVHDGSTTFAMTLGSARNQSWANRTADQARWRP